MNPQQRQRLEKLITELPRLPKEKFDFSKVVSHGTPKCGTTACAMGWTPVIFPEMVEWTGTSCSGRWGPAGLLIGGEVMHYHLAAEELFGIPSSIAEELFAPQLVSGEDYDEDGDDIRDWKDSKTHPVHSKLPLLREDATTQEVSDMLSRFLNLVDDGEIPVN